MRPIKLEFEITERDFYMIYIILFLVHVFTFFKRGHMESPTGQNPGKCCICGKIINTTSEINKGEFYDNKKEKVCDR